MSKSIISNEKKCFFCGATYNLHKHHCWHGTSNRKNSEKYGLWVYLCYYHHNGSNEGVHFNRSADLYLMQLSQIEWEKKHGERKKFIEIFGKSVL